VEGKEIGMSDTASTLDLVCPKCGGAMRSFERSSVTIDQCSECRGVFLDRGEIERLIDAESASFERQDPSRAQGDAERSRSEGHGASGRRRSGFLGSLFEGGD
jgi:Zn-finger nucleic acid-binding protein